MTNTYSRRRWLGGLGLAAVAAAVRPPASAAAGKPMRGIFPIMATPFTKTGAVDFEDLAREVEFLARCGVHGMVWPQLASLYPTLSREERLRGMEVLARAAKGMKPALVLGVQAANQAQMLEFAEKAESLEPDALIAMPPREAKSLEEYRAYYRALAKLARRPVFIQTTGGAKGLDPPVEFLVELAREFPHLGYVKEEVPPVMQRIKALVAAKPVIKGVFGGSDAVAMTYEMRVGGDGNMPSAGIADVQAQVWELYQSGRREQARTVFAAMLLMTNLMRHIPNVTPYLMKKRGVFRTTVTRRESAGRVIHEEARHDPDQIAEMDWTFEALRPYLRV